MKRLLFRVFAFIVLSGTVTAMVGCSGMRDDIDDLKEQVKTLNDESIPSIQTQITNINNSLTSLQALSTTVSNLQGQVSTLSGTLDTKINELKDLIAEGSVNKDDYAAFTKKVNDKILEFDNFLAGVETLASQDDIAGLQDQIDAVKEDVNGILGDYLKKSVYDLFVESVEARLGALEGAEGLTVADVEGMFNTDNAKFVAGVNAIIAAAVAENGDITSAIADQVEALTAEMVSDIAALRTDVDKLLAQIQSVVFVPEYSDGKADLTFMNLDVFDFPEINPFGGIGDFTYQLTGKDAEVIAAKIASLENPNEILSFNVKTVQTRAEEAQPSIEITGVKADGDKIIVSVAARDFKSFEEFNYDGYDGPQMLNEYNPTQPTESYSVALKIKTDATDIMASYVNTYFNNAYLTLSVINADGDPVWNRDYEFVEYLAYDSKDVVTFFKDYKIAYHGDGFCATAEELKAMGFQFDEDKWFKVSGPIVGGEKYFDADGYEIEDAKDANFKYTKAASTVAIADNKDNKSVGQAIVVPFSFTIEPTEEFMAEFEPEITITSPESPWNKYFFEIEDKSDNTWLTLYNVVEIAASETEFEFEPVTVDWNYTDQIANKYKNGVLAEVIFKKGTQAGLKELAEKVREAMSIPNGSGRIYIIDEDGDEVTVSDYQHSALLTLYNFVNGKVKLNNLPWNETYYLEFRETVDGTTYVVKGQVTLNGLPEEIVVDLGSENTMKFHALGENPTIDDDYTFPAEPFTSGAITIDEAATYGKVAEGRFKDYAEFITALDSADFDLRGAFADKREVNYPYYGFGFAEGYGPDYAKEHNTYLAVKASAASLVVSFMYGEYNTAVENLGKLRYYESNLAYSYGGTSTMNIRFVGKAQIVVPEYKIVAVPQYVSEKDGAYSSVAGGNYTKDASGKITGFDLENIMLDHIFKVVDENGNPLNPAEYNLFFQFAGDSNNTALKNAKNLAGFNFADFNTSRLGYVTKTTTTDKGAWSTTPKATYNDGFGARENWNALKNSGYIENASWNVRNGYSYTVKEGYRVDETTSYLVTTWKVYEWLPNEVTTHDYSVFSYGKNTEWIKLNGLLYIDEVPVSGAFDPYTDKYTITPEYPVTFSSKALSVDFDKSETYKVNLWKALSAKDFQPQELVSVTSTYSGFAGVPTAGYGAATSPKVLYGLAAAFDSTKMSSELSTAHMSISEAGELTISCPGIEANLNQDVDFTVPVVMNDNWHSYKANIVITLKVK